VTILTGDNATVNPAGCYK